jgi:general stress protein YciG
MRWANSSSEERVRMAMKMNAAKSPEEMSAIGRKGGAASGEVRHKQASINRRYKRKHHEHMHEAIVRGHPDTPWSITPNGRIYYTPNRIRLIKLGRDSMTGNNIEYLPRDKYFFRSTTESEIYRFYERDKYEIVLNEKATAKDGQDRTLSYIRNGKIVQWNPDFTMYAMPDKKPLYVEAKGFGFLIRFKRAFRDGRRKASTRLYYLERFHKYLTKFWERIVINERLAEAGLQTPCEWESLTKRSTKTHGQIRQQLRRWMSEYFPKDLQMLDDALQSDLDLSSESSALQSIITNLSTDYYDADAQEKRRRRLAMQHGVFSQTEQGLIDSPACVNRLRQIEQEFNRKHGSTFKWYAPKENVSLPTLKKIQMKREYIEPTTERLKFKAFINSLRVHITPVCV